MGDASQFMPGPYSVGTMAMTKRDWAELHSANLVIVQRGPDVLAAVWTGDDYDERAQAVLFAAAPDLLAAAKRALSVLRADGHASTPKNVLGALEAAIARATAPNPSRED